MHQAIVIVGNACYCFSITLLLFNNGLKLCRSRSPKMLHWTMCTLSALNVVATLGTLNVTLFELLPRCLFENFFNLFVSNATLSLFYLSFNLFTQSLAIVRFVIRIYLNFLTVLLWYCYTITINRFVVHF